MSSEHVNCPLCGRLGDGPRFARAGAHVLAIKQVVRGLGRGRGFLWSQSPVRLDVLHALEAALGRAMAQVQHLKAMAAGCPQCGGPLGFYSDLGRYGCDRCRVLF